MLQSEIARPVDAIAVVGLSNTLQDRLRASEAERERLEAQLLAHVAPSQQTLAEDVVERYRSLVEDLQTTLNNVQDRVRARKILADLLRAITTGRDGEGVLYAELEEPAGRLLLVTARIVSNVGCGGRI